MSVYRRNLWRAITRMNTAMVENRNELLVIGAWIWVIVVAILVFA